MRTKGHANMTNKLLPKNQIFEYLNSKTVKEGNCWLYTGLISFGYGTYKGYRVHRLAAWIFMDFELRSPLNINHKLECLNKNCWNPDHLYIGTQRDNTNDIIKMGKHHLVNKTHCPQGHEYNKKNTLIYDYGRLGGEIRNKRVCRLCKNAKQRARRILKRRQDAFKK